MLMDSARNAFKTHVDFMMSSSMKYSQDHDMVDVLRT